VNVYAESGAVLAWLLGEESGQSVREVLRHAVLVTASDLTLVECDRVLIRAVTMGEIDEVARPIAEHT
jgi:PIN domain nuclease of toxin-antitoxin system